MNRLETALTSVIDRIKPRLDFHALFPSTVKKQNGDLTLELVPDNTRLAPHSNVKIRVGIPGMQVKVAANARVLLGFEDGNPGRPYAALWESGSVTELVINGDLVKIGSSGGAEDFVALSTRTNSRLSALESAFNSHMHATAGPGPPTPPTPVPSVIPVVSPGSVASATLKAKG